MTLYLDKKAENNGDMKRLQRKFLEWLDKETMLGSDWLKLQGVTFTVEGIDPISGEVTDFVVRFDNHFYVNEKT